MYREGREDSQPWGGLWRSDGGSGGGGGGHGGCRWIEDLAGKGAVVLTLADDDRRRSTERLKMAPWKMEDVSWRDDGGECCGLWEMLSSWGFGLGLGRPRKERREAERAAVRRREREREREREEKTGSRRRLSEAPDGSVLCRGDGGEARAGVRTPAMAWRQGCAITVVNDLGAGREGGQALGRAAQGSCALWRRGAKGEVGWLGLLGHGREKWRRPWRSQAWLCAGLGLHKRDIQPML